MELAYLGLLERTVRDGVRTPNRTGIDTLRLRGHHALSFDLNRGRFPLLTTKKMPWQSIRVELEFFIKGLTDKRWLQERGCHFWDQWCSPLAVIEENTKFGGIHRRFMANEEKSKFQMSHHELGPIYGHQWRNFNGRGDIQGFDQLKWIVDELKTNPTNRQLVCSAWNPEQKYAQALPPCHVCWHVDVDGDQLNLCWFQRSCDAFLGVPCNIASYALLLRLLAYESGKQPGVLTGFFSNFHVYVNHVDQIKTQLLREDLGAPKLDFGTFNGSIFDWTYLDCVLSEYKSHGPLKGDVAV